MTISTPIQPSIGSRIKEKRQEEDSAFENWPDAPG